MLLTNENDISLNRMIPVDSFFCWLLRFAFIFYPSNLFWKCDHSSRFNHYSDSTVDYKPLFTMIRMIKHFIVFTGNSPPWQWKANLTSFCTKIVTLDPFYTNTHFPMFVVILRWSLNNSIYVNSKRDPHLNHHESWSSKL